MHVNGRIKSFTKDGAPFGALNATDAAFWGSVAPTGVADPEVRYDRLSGRWFLMGITVDEWVNNKIAIAVSDGPWDKVSHERLTPTSRSWTVADAVVRLVGALEAGRRPGQPLLPSGSGLHVNLPNVEPAQLAAAPFVHSRIGGTADYVPVFFGRLEDSALAVRLGQGSPLPGLSSVTRDETPPAGEVGPDDVAFIHPGHRPRRHARRGGRSGPDVRLCV